MTDFRTSRWRSARALTLIELIVVIVLVSILFSFVAVATNRSSDTSADKISQATVSAVLDAQTVLYRRDRMFVSDPAEIADVNPKVRTVGAAPSTGDTTASLWVLPNPSDPTDARTPSVGVAAQSQSGACWLALLAVNGGTRTTRYGTFGPEEGLACTGETAANMLAAVTGASAADGASWGRPVELSAP